MRIKNAEIYGFGKWVDFSLTFSEKGLTCFYGENEAGKSTLQQFFLYMLFGLPPKMIKHYTPKSSSRLGGLLTITLSNNYEVTIERVGQECRCFLPDGKTVDGDEWLQNNLRGLTRETYTSIYAFSALDLFELHQVKAGQLNDVLFSVGLTGSTAIYEVEKDLTKRLDELYKRTGKNPMINKQINLTKAAEAKMLQAKLKEASYRDLLLHKEKKEKTLENTSDRLQRNLEKSLYLEKLLQSLTLFNQYNYFQNKLSQMPKTFSFPEEGIRRFQILHERLLPLESELRLIESNTGKLQEKVAEAEAKQFDHSVYLFAERLYEEQIHNDGRQISLSEIKEELQHVNALIKNGLESINLAEDDIEHTKFLFQTELTWRKIAEEAAELQRLSGNLTEEFEDLERSKSNLLKEKMALESELLPDAELSNIEKQLNAHKQQENMASMKELQNKMGKKREVYARLSFVIVLVLAGVLSAIAFLNERFEFFLIVMLLIVLLFIQMKIFREKPNQNEMKNTLSLLQSDEVLFIEKQLKEQQQKEMKLSIVMNEIERLATQRTDWQNKSHQFSLREHRWLQAVKGEMEQYSFLDKIEPIYWTDLYREIKDMQKLLEQRKILIEKQQNLREQSGNFHTELVLLAKKIGAEETHFSAHQLARILDEYKQREQTIVEYKEMIANNDKEKPNIEEQIRTIKIEIDQLFQTANVTSEEAFFRVATEFETKQKLSHDLEQIHIQLSHVFSQAQIKKLIGENLNKLQLENDMQVLKEEIDHDRKLQEELKESLITITLETNQLESSEDYSQALHTYELKRGRLNALAKEWSIYQIAYATLMKAKDKYREKYFHDVLAYTEKYFTYLTNGVYERVYPPTNAEPFQVEATNKMRYTVSELSKGTVDQLYVVLRLAISKVMGDKFNIPLMIDDAFIHFDHGRTMLAINLLQEFAKDQQIFFYTCRKEIANALQDNNGVSLKKI